MAGIIDVKGGNGVSFMVAAGIVYEIIAAACSSPQTMEINASARAGTLMKWVYIGLGQSALFITAAVIIEPSKAKPVIAGGSLAAAVMYLSYSHAMQAGLASDAPGTEDYTGGNNDGI